MASTANSPPFTTYGATATTFLTTTISLSSYQASFTILYPPPATEAVQYTTFPVAQNPSSTYTPTPLPILVLTNVVGIALNPSSSPIATRTLGQRPPPQATSTSTSTSFQSANCDSWKWKCWPGSKQIGICLGIGLGSLLLLLFLWWLFFWRLRFKKIRIRRGRTGDEEGVGRPPLKIAVRTSMSQTRSRSKSAREGSLTPSPRPRGSVGIRVVGEAGGPIDRTGNGIVKEPTAYRVVRQPGPRELVRPLSMPDAPGRGEMDGVGETRVRDFAMPVAAASVDVGAGSEFRSGRRENRSEGEVRVSRGESTRESRGSRRERREAGERIEMRERSERRKGRERDNRDEYDRRRSRSHRERDEEYDDRHVERRSRRHSYAPRDEEDFEVRRDSSPRRRNSGRDGERRRPRSVSPPHRDRSNDMQKKRRDSESGIGSGLKKLFPFLLLVLGLMTTIGEPKGGWDQYIPEDKRKKGKMKKMAEDAFDKHRHKIPKDFPRHLHQHSPRSKSAGRAYRSTRPLSSPSPPLREDLHKTRDANRYRGSSARAVGNIREAFNSIAPEQGSADTTLTPSPPSRRRRLIRDRRVGGYDGVGDEDCVVHSAEAADGNVGEVVLPYEISEPESPVLRAARTFPMNRGFEDRSKYGKSGLTPPTPPSTVR